MTILCKNSVSEDMNTRLSSLKTLGYICEELKTDELNDELKNSIILSLTNNIMNGEEANGVLEPSKLAIVALGHSIPFTV